MKEPVDHGIESRRRPTVAVIGLAVAALAILMILPVRRGADAGFALIVAPLLIASAVALWRGVRGALVWSLILGCLLVLMFSAYAVAGLADDGEFGVLLIDIAVILGGVLTVVESMSALIQRRRSAMSDVSSATPSDRA